MEVNAAVKLGLELIASRPASLRLGTFFETWIATSEGTVRRSLGRDEYHLALTLEAGSRLAATGRTHICQLDMEAAGLGANGARPATMVPAVIGPATPAIWGVRTNLFLSLKALSEAAGARLLREGRPPLAFEIENSLVESQEVAPGRYILDVSALLLD